MKKIKSKDCLTNPRCVVVGANRCVQTINHEEAPPVIVKHPC